MPESHGNQAAVLQACQAEAEQLRAERGWRLLDPAEWAARAVAYVADDARRNPRSAAVSIYSQSLYEACSGRQGERRQDQAYDELFRYLYALARARYPLIYEDIAQQAIERVYQRFSQCRDAGTFLSFAFHQLLSAASGMLRPRALELSGGLHGGLNGADILASLPDLRPDPVAALITDELRASFARLSAEFLRKHPRASLQLEALRLKYLDGLDDTAIAVRLGKPPASVYVLRARAIEKLRAEPEWRALAVEFGVLPED